MLHDKEYDVCGMCVAAACASQDAAYIEDHDHPVAFVASVSRHYVCDICASEVVGPSYHCVECQDYDICGSCFAKCKLAATEVQRPLSSKPMEGSGTASIGNKTKWNRLQAHTDNAPQHFKLGRRFADWMDFERVFGVLFEEGVVWDFGCPNEGKGVWDGLGGFIKACAARDILYGKVTMKSAHDFYLWAHKWAAT